jgi:predicted RNA binding protein YcfA (HicA-like mRNA interferase family)
VTPPAFPGEVDGARFLRALARFGWKVTAQRGRHGGKTHFLIVAFHDGLGRNSARAILRKAGIDEDAFLDVF